ncbi:hypothetical protein CSOJ01_13875 [Colletotrichum sojae]|uniref:Uncharacterized protein n=1 Tax=Colletotrichum sojae TaxID=2175907 RepID=A0A8H6MJS2_9PEZI|nr:hypothetical protein CSOJ01_13875 [Colletotrichum sojae]
MQSPTSSPCQLPQQGPPPTNSSISPGPRSPSPDDIVMCQATVEGNSGHIDPTNHDVPEPAAESIPRSARESDISKPAESFQPSAPERAPNPGEAIPLVGKNDKAKAGVTRSRIGIVTIFSDIVAVVVPLAFLTFMVIVWNLDAEQVEGDSLQKWQNAITVLATLFPILFATIFGRLMSEAARWKLEKGSRIGLLEQLMGNPLSRGQRSWGLALNRFVDPFWFNKSNYNSDLKRYFASPAMTAPKQISHFSWPKTFMWIAEIPLATGNSDISTVYLADPSLKMLFNHRRNSTMRMSMQVGQPFLDDFDERVIGVRLSQLLNTYLLLSQASVDISGGDNLDGQPGTILTDRAEATEIVEEYLVSKTWLWLGIASSVVLLAGGILSVVFANLTRGPEILGYVSTIVRNSKFVEVPPNTSWLDAADLRRMIKDERIRHGFTDMASGEEEQQIGVGYQDSTGPIGGAAAHEK